MANENANFSIPERYQDEFNVTSVRGMVVVTVALAGRR